jgi:hypothetical protein
MPNIPVDRAVDKKIRRKMEGRGGGEAQGVAVYNLDVKGDDFSRAMLPF